MKSNGLGIKPWFWMGLVALVLAGTIAGTYRYTRQEPLGAALDSPPPPEARPLTVQPDHSYYVYVKELEVTPQKPNGGRWDHADGSAPDLKYSITWQGNKVFTSLQRTDQLVAHWELLSVDLAQVVQQKGRLDPQSLISAPVIHTASTGDTLLTIEAWDNDPIGSDAAGKLDVDISKLLLGDNDLPNLPAPMKRLTLSVVDQQQTLTQLVETLNKR